MREIKLKRLSGPDKLVSWSNIVYSTEDYNKMMNKPEILAALEWGSIPLIYTTCKNEAIPSIENTIAHIVKIQLDEITCQFPDVNDSIYTPLSGVITEIMSNPDDYFAELMCIGKIDDIRFDKSHYRMRDMTLKCFRVVRKEKGVDYSMSSNIADILAFCGKKVFLGGTCNDSTWRDEIIPKLKISYFNPVVDDWTEECYQRELKEREQCDYCLYVITPKMTGTYSIAEVIDDSNKRPEKTIFMFLKEDGDKKFDASQIKSLDKVGVMVKQNGGKYFKDKEELLAYLNS